MPHVPLYCSDDFEGLSGKGLYWDVMLEIDWSVGEINRILKEHGLDQNTIIILSSDNGPWISYGNHAGITPFREAKGTTFDGGIRSACIIKYPAGLEAGAVSERAFSSVDLLPSLCQVAEIPLPVNEIDGLKIWEYIKGAEGAENPQDYYAFSNNRNFEGIISGDGRWKLHLPHAYRVLETNGADGIPGKYGTARIDTALFDMKADPYETSNVITAYPEVAAEMIQLAEGHARKFYSEK